MAIESLPTWGELLKILPEIILVAGGTAVMVLEPLLPRGRKGSLGGLSLLFLFAALIGTWYAHTKPGTAFYDMIVVDNFATFFRSLVIIVGILTVLTSLPYLRREKVEHGEYYALILFSLVGQCLLGSSNELIMLFIGLEVSSIATYVLAGYLRDDWRAVEASIKYFLLGSFATAFILYGIAVVYGGTGATKLEEIRAILLNPNTSPSALLVAAATALFFVGLGFKVSAVPFQVWTPDVYQGAPTPVAAFLSTGPKAAAFAALLRIFMSAFESAGQHWFPIVWGSALLTMIMGNFAALVQTNVKRLLAYSSIAHAGYVLVALAAQNHAGVSAAMFYVAAYAFMNLGAFAVIAHFAREGERYLSIDDLSGLATTHPTLAATFAIFLLSLIGVPLTGGFFGKFYIFRAALDAGLIWLTVLGLLTSAVAAYYYLRILVVMYMQEPGEPARTLPPLSASLKWALLTAAAATLLLGIVPGPVLDFASQSLLVAAR